MVMLKTQKEESRLKDTVHHRRFPDHSARNGSSQLWYYISQAANYARTTADFQVTRLEMEMSCQIMRRKRDDPVYLSRNGDNTIQLKISHR